LQTNITQYEVCQKNGALPKTYAELVSWSGPAPINGDCPVPCPVEPLRPITDPDALRFENGDTVREDRLSSATQAKIQCLRSALSRERPAGSITITSAWRPQPYQDHLKDIVDKLAQLNTHPSKSNPNCAPIKATLMAEKARHGLGTLVGRTSNHTSGNAFDANWSVTNAKIDTLAAPCGLTRPFPAIDPVHFQ
jgi:hypothetical protein